MNAARSGSIPSCIERSNRVDGTTLGVRPARAFGERSARIGIEDEDPVLFTRSKRKLLELHGQAHAMAAPHSRAEIPGTR